MDIKEAYKVMQKHCEIEVGDTVRVLRRAKSREMGWDDNWIRSMDKYIGENMEVSSIGKYGICLGCGYSFPFFVLELVKKKEKNKLPDHIQTVIDKGDFGYHKEAVENLVAELIKNKEGE